MSFSLEWHSPKARRRMSQAPGTPVWLLTSRRPPTTNPLPREALREIHHEPARFTFIVSATSPWCTTSYFSWLPWLWASAQTLVLSVAGIGSGGHLMTVSTTASEATTPVMSLESVTRDYRQGDETVHALRSTDTAPDRAGRSQGQRGTKRFVTAEPHWLLPAWRTTVRSRVHDPALRPLPHCCLPR